MDESSSNQLHNDKTLMNNRTKKCCFFFFFFFFFFFGGGGGRDSIFSGAHPLLHATSIFVKLQSYDFGSTGDWNN